MPTSSRFSLLNWLLAGIMGLSLALNAYLLTPHYSTPGSRWLIGIADDMWDEDDDDDTDNYRESRAALADELRRTRLQLEYCRDSCQAVSTATPAPTAVPLITPAAP
ncbi:hypothetical protein J0X19_09510 [Hymenobacter sp. BT186]|uniref:Uncharacterized protein n=1 Tax=Hymenobacter telluris TaxID=2816474 RepID=A0A939J8W1_9BACT|nr:hypothetical protein [Hymenobacter telluris]MBO0358179.1 hypothetical protein [Hymenobacter telluris]MBW3374206.1 hypothetical protein [Hymenobacter norwichensis]